MNLATYISLFMILVSLLTFPGCKKRKLLSYSVEKEKISPEGTWTSQCYVDGSSSSLKLSYSMSDGNLTKSISYFSDKDCREKNVSEKLYATTLFEKQRNSKVFSLRVRYTGHKFAVHQKASLQLFNKAKMAGMSWSLHNSEDISEVSSALKDADGPLFACGILNDGGLRLSVFSSEKKEECEPGDLFVREP